MKSPRQEPLSHGDGADVLRESAVEGDRKFWSGERSMSVVQWLGVLLMFVCVTVPVAVWVRGQYGIFVALLGGGLVFFVVLGNRRARHKARSPEKH